MRIKKRDKTEEKVRRRGFASGCMGVLFEVGVWTVSTVFMTIGGAMFVFGVFSFEPEITSATIFVLVAVPVAVFFFIRTGRSILRDLRNPNRE
ncbi:MAG: hypothetical protein ACR2N0_07850 [Rubrobacteraceae bacterium]